MQGRPAGAQLAEDDLIQVTGPFRRFNLAEFERDLGVDLDDNRFAAYDGQPAIVARSTSLTPRGGDDR